MESVVWGEPEMPLPLLPPLRQEEEVRYIVVREGMWDRRTLTGESLVHCRADAAWREGTGFVVTGRGFGGGIFKAELLLLAWPVVVERIAGRAILA